MTVAELIKALIDTGRLDYTVTAEISDGVERKVLGAADISPNIGPSRSLTAGWVTLDIDKARLMTGHEPTIEGGAVPLPCGRCGSNPGTMPGYDPARGRFCRACADRCHESTDAFHICEVCAAPEERYP